MAAASRYILHKKVARGGMAEIFLGKQIGEDGFQRICCIKRILPHFAQEKEFIAMFRDEAHIGKRLQHANIVRVEGFEEVEGSYAIIMEFVNGGDLRAILAACEAEKAVLTVAMSVFVVAEAARGLHFAHTRADEISGKPLDIVHRDISPQNILVSFEGEVKVTDFGIADAETKATETKPGIVKGKYSYMSPEQISAKPVDARTDVFALSILLWESLAMRRLFQGENEVMTIQKVKNCEISADISVLNRQVDAELKAIILKGLAKNPQERYASAAALEGDLRRYLSRRYADFTVADLGNFVKRVMAKRRTENTAFIKELLSASFVPADLSDSKAPVVSPAAPEGSVASQIGSRNRVAITIDDALSSPMLRVQGEYAPPENRHQYGRSPGTAVPGTAAIPKTVSSGPFPLSGTKNNPSPAPQKRALAGASPSFYNTTKPQKRSRIPLFLGIVSVLGILAAGLYFWQEGQKVSTQPAALQIQTIPATVKIALNASPLFNARYIETPVAVTNLAPGFYRMTLSRDGYADEILEFTIAKNQQLQKTGIVLKRIATMAPVVVRLDQPVNHEVRIDVDNGIAQALIGNNKPASVDDITFGARHQLTIYPGFPSTDGAFACAFIPRSNSWQDPYIVAIDLAARKCGFPLR